RHEESMTLTIKKALFSSETPWIVFNESGKTIARFAEREDAGAFLYPDADDQEDRDDKIASLKRILDDVEMALDPEYGFNNDELLELGIGYGIPGPLSNEQVRREAAAILAELESAGK